MIRARPKELLPPEQSDLIRAALDQTNDLGHPLVKSAGKIDRAFLQARFGAVYIDESGHTPDYLLHTPEAECIG